MDFFETPPPPPEFMQDQAYRQPPWICAPENELPGNTELRVIGVQTDDLVIAVQGVQAYSCGWKFNLFITQREYSQDLMNVMFGPPPGMPGAPTMEERLRFGFQFSDGSKVTSMQMFHGFGEDHDPMKEPAGPVMQFCGGGGGGMRTVEHGLWCWPLPSAGEAQFVLDWKSRGISMIEIPIDTAPILDAAKRSEVLWSDDHLPPPDFGHGGITVSTF
jgi:hypothetical protein